MSAPDPAARRTRAASPEGTELRKLQPEDDDDDEFSERQSLISDYEDQADDAGGDAATHTDFFCDDCQVSPIVGTRYRSTRGQNVDLCENCVGLRPSSEQAEFAAVRRRKRGTDVATTLRAAGGFGQFQWLVLATNCCAQAGFAIWIMQPVFLNPKLEVTTELTESELALASTAFFFGWALATPVISQAADVFGRRRVGIAAYAGALVCSLLSGLCTTFGPLAAARGCLGACVGGAASVCYVWCTEFMPDSARSAVTTGLSSFWALSAALVAGSAWALQGVSVVQEVAMELVVAGFALVLMCVGVPESPQYLSSAGRDKEAAARLVAIAETNGARLPASWRLTPSEGPSRQYGDSNGGALAAAPKAGYGLLLGSELRTTTLSLCLCWFGVTLAYYGLSYSAGSLGGGLYTNSAMLALADIPGNLLWTVLADRPSIGRKRSMVGLFTVGGVLLLAVWAGAGPAVAMAGRIGMAAVFVGVYVYAAEVFPTSVRALGLGLCNVFARVGGMAAPLAAELGSGSFLLFGALALACALSSWCWLPEPKRG